MLGRVRAPAWVGLPVLIAAMLGWPAIVAWGAVLVEPWAWVAGLAAGASLAPTPQGRAELTDWSAIERAQQAESDQSSAAPSASKKEPSARSPKRRASNTGTPSLYVSADTVVRLSRSASIPANRYVEASGKRPAGLQLAGVSGLGIGVRDGDVLTRVAGAPVASQSAVVSLVLKLRARKAKAISGELWRGQQRWQIVFEMPYLAKPAPPSTANTNPAAAKPPTPRASDPARAVPRTPRPKP